MDTIAERISALKLLPPEDKDFLLNLIPKGYKSMEESLQELSIFRRNITLKESEHYVLSECEDFDVYYAGIYPGTNLGIFFDNDKKIIFGCRFFLSHLNAFINNIDACLHHLKNIKIDERNQIDIGSNFIVVEKWFSTYGHFQDEIFQLADLLSFEKYFNHRGILDYPNDAKINQREFRFNYNYMNIDYHILGSRSLNIYNFKNSVVKLNNLTIVHNKFKSANFHSFPKRVVERLLTKLSISKSDFSYSGIFLTRSNSYRDIINKNNVEQDLVSRNFLLVNPENVSYEELIKLVNSASTIVMYYGSALTNMVYFPEKCNVFILKSESYMTEQIDLWSKLIMNYNLDVQEIYSTDNIIDIEKLNVAVTNKKQLN